MSRADSRDEWLARTADEQVVINIKACLLALTETALTLLKTGDSRDFLRAARALSLHFPPVQRVEDVGHPVNGEVGTWLAPSGSQICSPFACPYSRLQ